MATDVWVLAAKRGRTKIADWLYIGATAVKDMVY